METKTEELSVEQLMTTLQAGDITAFEMLFRTYYQPLCNYAYTFVQDRDEAEEIVQAIFLSVWEKRDKLDIHTGVRPYLYAMVRNAALNILKHEKIKQQHVALELAVADRSVESVTRTVLASELETRIHKALEKLPEQCRLVFKLSRFEELKYAEIAEQLNISIKTVENQMGKALKIMREQLKDYLPLFLVFLNGLLN
ncbi:MAG TPA: RNA polymerase sigma-70 factor [Chryseolinea sp.]|nr:RNA polymerase sigma-70 factor [Chryseolinea sp.]